MYNFHLPEPDGSLAGQQGLLWVRGQPQLFTFGANNEFVCGDVIVHRPYAWMLTPNPEQITKPGSELYTFNEWMDRGRIVMKGQKSTKKINGRAVFTIAQTKILDKRAMSQIDNTGTKPAIIPPSDDNSSDHEYAGRGAGEACPSGIDGTSKSTDCSEPSPFAQDGYGS